MSCPRARDVKAPTIFLLAISFASFVASPLLAQSDITVVLTNPVAEQTVDGETEIHGSVSGLGFSRYDLYYRPVGVESEYIYFGGDSNAVDDGVLGTWSGGSLEPGDYEIRLTAYFGDQQVVEESVRFALADKTNVGELAEAGGVGPGGRSGPDNELQEALDDLVVRTRPENLWSYLERGVRLSATIGGLVLVYFLLKSLIVWLLRSTSSTR